LAFVTKLLFWKRREQRKMKALSEWEAAILGRMVDLDLRLEQSETRIDRQQETLMELESQQEAGSWMCALCII
jgi:hypothetical protein